VKIRNGPAAVTLPFIIKGNPFSQSVPLFFLPGNGKVAERAGESEDLPETEKKETAAWTTANLD
jgi:hypothetical protein